MTKKSDNNNNNNNNQPLDDLGVKNDQIINCAEKIIDEIWIKLNAKSSKDINASDMLAYSSTLCNVWALVKNMMDFLEETYDEEIQELDPDDTGNKDKDEGEDDNDIEKVGNIADNDKIVCI